MSVINPGSNLQFKSTDFLFARVRKRLKSFDNAGLLDEGDWYQYIKDVLNSLGVSTYEEKEAITEVRNFKANLPEDFAYLYAAYKCTPNIGENSKNTLFPQTGFVFYIEDTYQPFRKCKNCLSAKVDYADGVKFTTRTFIEGQPIVTNFNSPMLLRLSGNAKGICKDDCRNLFAKCAYEITIDKNFIHTNFKNDAIYMKYYGLSIDPESGLPMIPDNTFVEKAIEDYIVYRVLADFWYNGDVPDMQARYQTSKLEYEDSLKQAMYWAKLPSFQNVINKIRVDRKNLRIYQQLDNC